MFSAFEEKKALLFVYNNNIQHPVMISSILLSKSLKTFSKELKMSTRCIKNFRPILIVQYRSKTTKLYSAIKLIVEAL